MLSLDFTDRQVKIVRGSLSGSKIRIIQVVSLELVEGLIENGFVADVPMLASEILESLRANDIKEKEVVAEIGSGLILHKELVIPKPKNMNNSFVIETMIQNNMNLNNEYNITFNIVEETVDENNNPMVRLMATAVPQRLVDGYIKLFSHLGIALKGLYVSTNCISRLVQNNSNLASLMPLMMVEVESDFISINLYDDSRVLLSRRVSVDERQPCKAGIRQRVPYGPVHERQTGVKALEGDNLLRTHSRLHNAHQCDGVLQRLHAYTQRSRKRSFLLRV